MIWPLALGVGSGKSVGATKGWTAISDASSQYTLLCLYVPDPMVVAWVKTVAVVSVATASTLNKP